MHKVGKLDDMKVVQEELDAIVQWADTNNMSLNELKFVYLRYRTHKSNPIEYLPFNSDSTTYTTPSGHILSPSIHTRDLGIQISADYHWSHHIAEMVDTATTTASWALGVFRNRSRSIMLDVYKSLIRSKLEFSCPLWNPLDVGNIRRIENVQREFTRRIAGLQDLDYWARLKNLHLMSLQRRRERYSIIHIWKILNNLSPNDIGLKFTTSARRGT